MGWGGKPAPNRLDLNIQSNFPDIEMRTTNNGNDIDETNPTAAVGNIETDEPSQQL